MTQCTPLDAGQLLRTQCKGIGDVIVSCSPWALPNGAGVGATTLYAAPRFVDPLLSLYLFISVRSFSRGLPKKRLLYMCYKLRAAVIVSEDQQAICMEVY